eukprot:6643384-Pyramimonas_sp.AAC.1
MACHELTRYLQLCDAMPCAAILLYAMLGCAKQRQAVPCSSQPSSPTPCYVMVYIACPLGTVVLFDARLCEWRRALRK